MTLTGSAPYNYQRNEAEFVAGNDPGVIGLHDQIELTIGAPTPADVRHSIDGAARYVDPLPARAHNQLV